MHRPPSDTIKRFSLDLTQAANTYDLCTATGGDVVIYLDRTAWYVDTAGTLFTDVAVQTDQTTPNVLLTAGEGALANILAQATLAPANVTPFILKAGQKIQYTITGAQGTGAVSVYFHYRPASGGGHLA